MPETQDLRRRLESARLYFICGASPGGRPLIEFLPAVLEAGVDVFQLRDKELDDDGLTAVARDVCGVCRAAGSLFFVNDRPQVAVAVGADGVHVGQDDLPVARAREIVGAERLVGLSTHSPAQVADATAADYIGVGPVNETPTKPGRPAAGLELVRYAASHAPVPFFAIGGIDAGNVGAVVAAGARRVAVVRAIADAPDPAGAVRSLRTALEHAEVTVDAA